MKKFNIKILYTFFIIIGAALVLYEQFGETNQNGYILACGFIVLMFGLYKATTQWVKDNKETDHKENSAFFEDEGE